MSLFESIFRLSEVAQASYVNLSDQEKHFGLADSATVTDRLKDASSQVAGSNFFASTQANRFLAPGSGFTLLHHTPNDPFGFSASAFRDNESGKLVLAMRGTEPPGVDLVSADLDIATSGLAFAQIVSMYNYVQRLKAPTGADVDVTQLVYEELGTPPTDGRAYLTVIPQSRGEAGTTIPGRYIVLNQVTVKGIGQGVITATDIANGVTITGHSLGGHLAIAASRLFSELTTDVVVFDSAGFKSTSTDPFFALFPGAASSFDAMKVTSVYGRDGLELTSNEFVHEQIGTRVALPIEPRADSPIQQHVIPHVTDMLALYQAIGALDTQLANASRFSDIEDIVRASSDEPGKTIEATLDALRKVFFGHDAIKGDPTPVGDKEKLYVNLQNLQSNALYQSLATVGTANNAQPGRIVALTAKNTETLVAEAQDDFGVFAALVNVAPLAVVNADAVYQTTYAQMYSEWQADVARPVDDRNISEQWYRDRAELLVIALQANTRENAIPNVVYMAREDRRFIDKDSNTTIGTYQHADPSRPLPETALTVFGGSDEDEGAAALQGSAFSDHLYGEGGNDEVHGQGGDDYLEGGQGNDQLFGEAANDTLVGGVGNDELTGGAGSDRLEGGRGVDTYQFSALDLRDSSTDTIRDVDGQGVIKIDGVALNAAGAKALSPNTWDLQDGTRVFLISNQASDGVPSDTLLIKKPGHDGSYIKIENFHQGDFGLTLPDFLEGQRAINSDLSTAADYAVLQSAANISLDLSSGVRNQLIAGSSGSGPQSYSALSATQADALLAKYDIVYQYANDESGFSATVFKDNVTGQFVLSVRGMEFEPNRVDTYAKDTKLGALRDINREGFAFGQIMSMERLTGHLLNGETLNRVTGEWEPNAALQNFSAEAYGGRLIVTGADIGGHLATAFTLLNSGLVKRTYSFDGIGLGAINGGEPTAEKLGDLLDQFRAMMSYRGEAVQSPYWDEINAAGLGDNYKLALEADKGDAYLTLTSQLYYTPYGPAGIIGSDPIIQANPTNGYEHVNIYKSQLYQFVANYLGRQTGGAGQGSTGAFDLKNTCRQLLQTMRHATSTTRLAA